MARPRATAENSILCVVGARPNFIKIMPIMAALRARPSLTVKLVHTSQHYDEAMNDIFFEDLGIPRPEVELGVGSGTHAAQTAATMERIEPVIDAAAPRLVVVVGDTNSTLAAALVAAKKGVPVAHVEAGLRSFDRSMPEEINRVLTDQISDLLFTTERSGGNNLSREGVAPERVHFVGNVMIDSLKANLAHALLPAATFAEASAPPPFREPSEGFAVLTLHRPSNVDDPATLKRLLGTVGQIAPRLPVVFPIHPRTKARIAAAGLEHHLDRPEILCLAPIGYRKMLGLMAAARVVLTDSGGMQEETTALGVPCLTLRDNTERPVTVEQGTNTIVGTDPRRTMAAVDDLLRTGGKRGRVPELWDGHAAVRIAAVVAEWLGRRQKPPMRHD